jgi:hypothetical protein
VGTNRDTFTARDAGMSRRHMATTSVTWWMATCITRTAITVMTTVR